MFLEFNADCWTKMNSFAPLTSHVHSVVGPTCSDARAKVRKIAGFQLKLQNWCKFV